MRTAQVTSLAGTIFLVLVASGCCKLHPTLASFPTPRGPISLGTPWQDIKNLPLRPYIRKGVTSQDGAYLVGWADSATSTTKGMLLRSTDNGKTWSFSFFPDHRLGTLRFEANGKHGAVTSYYSHVNFMMSDDGGQHWRAARSPHPDLANAFFSTVVPNSSGSTYAIASRGGTTPKYLYESTDRGLTWEQKLEVKGGMLSFNNSQAGILIEGDSPYSRSKDHGQTWSKVSNNYTDGIPVQVVVDADGAFTAILLSGTGGLHANFIRYAKDDTKIVETNLGIGKLVQHFDTFPNSIIIAASDNLIVRSTDGGKTFSEVFKPDIGFDIRAIVRTGMDTEVAFVSNITDRSQYKFYRSDDQGKSWSAQ